VKSVNTLRVLLDLRHPLAFLALQPAIAFAESLAEGALGVETDWLPLSVPPIQPPSAAKEGDDRGIRHRRYRARFLAREIATYAAAQDVVLREPYRNGDVEAGNLGWLWVRERHRDRLHAYLSQLFRGYWSQELDASSGERIAALIDSMHAEGAAFLDWSVDEGPRAAAAQMTELRDQGLFQVPAFIVEDEVFYGRQHLPMIRWILEGRSGPIPI
jgi:2-hydroxychromene-2-carboxylate isomerase